ncbi:MAG TPA: serine/threonine-protein kinase [bacterium]|nr:serine/threonine-protein kinase [bacterium]
MRRTQPPSSSDPGSGTSSGGRFLPGTVLAGRYRIVARVGRGGMGEVFRADDLKLDQPVALKFLPPEVRQDPSRLQRLLSEVRIARQVSHPNVCRVYDVVEADGEHFLAMELVDGEDLASLLRKVERLTGDRAVRIARQIGLGLHAAHELGVLHRDLKPHNVMIDREGRVRITDFGLAVLEDQVGGDEILSGTPAYMAPEQIAGQSVTTRSDIYSFGIVLYELFTGRRPFPGKDRPEAPSAPSGVVTDLDPAVEQVILRCLESDPQRRPASALAVVSALPGGDPLAAALEAGETPSPAVVADAGAEGTLTPRIAVAVLLFTLAAIVLSVHLFGQDSLLAKAKPDLPPAVLEDRARQILSLVGHEAPATDSAYTIWSAFEVPRFIAGTDSSLDRWDRLADERPHAIAFNYRQAPEPLVPFSAGGVVDDDDPPPTRSGMAAVYLNGNGLLYGMEIVPPQLDESAGPYPEPEWEPLFEAASLNPEDFEPTSPQWNPGVYCDERAAWTGEPAGWLAQPVRVEAGAYHGKPVYFQIADPALEPWRDPGSALPGNPISRVFFPLLNLCVIVGGAILAVRNLRLGRGDRRGALIVGGLAFGAYTLSWVFAANHSGGLAEINQFLEWTGKSLMEQGVIVAMMYLVLEPFIRRRWPASLVSWSRLMAGRVRDPLVGRHILYGAAIGAAALLLSALTYRAPLLLGQPPGEPLGMDWDALKGTRWVIAELLYAVRHSLAMPMTALFLIALVAQITRRRWIALVFVSVVFILPDPSWQTAPWVQIPPTLLIAAMFVTMLVRFGLVAGIVAIVYGSELPNYPLTLDFSHWYAGSTILALSVAAALPLYGFFVSLGGRPLLADEE